MGDTGVNTLKITLKSIGIDIKLLPDSWASWGTKFSIWPAHLVTACCGVEFAHTSAPGYDAERWGFLPIFGPRQTNAIVIEGTVTRKMAKVVKVAYEQMPYPKFVIAMGSCAMEGGVFWNSYHVVKVSDIIPVDAWVMGCPPTPEAVIRAIRMVQDKIEGKEVKPNIRPSQFDLTKLKPDKPQRPPNPPHRIEFELIKDINVCKPMPNVKWELGQKLVDGFKSTLGNGVKNAVVRNVNDLCITLDGAGRLREAVESAFKLGFDHVKSINVIDLINAGVFRMEYVLGSYMNKELMPVLLTIYFDVPRDEAKVPSIIDLYPGADYQERELYDLFGVWFEGNPWMGSNFLLDPDTPVKYPLRKEYRIPSLKGVVVER
ncbi:MAG: NADH-quinone oxidoreductase subunit NuoB [Caldivirga sp.]